MDEESPEKDTDVENEATLAQKEWYVANRNRNRRNSATMTLTEDAP